ncbi:MAG TPA: hypothetical protein VEA19_03300, partial [Actinomycetota bacterium]|nr:hypothetical protein [Actinomycetota bacterium]
MRRSALALALTVGTLAHGYSPAWSSDSAQGCEADARVAARRLVDRNATLDRAARIGGLDSAIVTDQRIAPGFATALLRIDGAFCSVERFNDAASDQMPGASPEAIATAFASVVAMPYLGEVRVDRVARVGSVVSLRTSGGRHGAVSSWVVSLDGSGVRAAKFVTTGWDRSLQRGSAGDLEGVTSLPGHTRTFTRLADGRVVIDATVMDLLERSYRERDAAVARAAAITGRAPGDDLKHTFTDGFTIKVSYGMSPYTPDAGMDTGVKQADRLRTILAGVISHYKDFLRWGARDPFDNDSRTFLGNETGLPEAVGYINVDSPMSPVCLACAYIADTLEVHIMLLFPELAPELVPVSYPDSEKFLQTVIGHEMVHSLQGG